MNPLFEMLSYPFIQRALIVGLMLSLCAALVGVSLVLRKNSMLGDGLAHTAFGAFALATVPDFTPIWFALPVVIIASFFILRLSSSKNLSGDSLVAILSASSLAIGTVAISIKGVNIDLNSYLFGSILSVSWADVLTSIILTLIVTTLYLFSYHRIFAITFDEAFAESIGIKTKLYDIIFAVVCSIIVVLGLRLLGSLLISSLIIFPALSAMHLTKSFKQAIILSAIISVIAFLIGLTLSYFLAIPTGATVVLTNLMIFLLSHLV